MTALKDLFDLTEFSFVDPESVHLVGRSANAFESPLLAKAAAEVTDQLVKGLTDQFVENYCYNSECEVCKGRFMVLNEADPTFVEKAKLKAKDRKALPESAFALPEKREYPIHDENHARAALSMLHNASPEDQKRIKAAVHRRYPNIEIDGDKTVAEKTEKTSVSTDEALSQTHAVDSGPEGASASPSADDGGEPRSVSFPHNAAGDGGGDTAPDEDTHRSEAESQTAGAQTNKASEGDETGDQTEKAPYVAMDNATAIAGGAEQDADGAIRRNSEGSSLIDQTSKEEIEMNHDELQKELNERDERLTARVLDGIRADRKARKEAKKAKAAKAAEEAAEAAAKAAEGEGTEKAAEGADEASKAAEGAPTVEQLQKTVAGLEETISKMASEDGRRAMLNGAGVAAVLRGPEAESIFKALDERVEKAQESGDPEAIRTALFQRTAAKMVARENARERGELPRSSRFGPDSVELFARTGTLPDDTKLHGV